MFTSQLSIFDVSLSCRLIFDLGAFMRFSIRNEIRAMQEFSFVKWCRSHAENVAFKKFKVNESR